jgi:hypothetical protein
MVSSALVGALEAMTLRLEGGVGPPGDYVYGDQRTPWTEAGMWGLLRVLPQDAEGGPAALPCADCDRPRIVGYAATATGAGVLVGAALWWRRRRGTGPRMSGCEGR